MRIGGLFCSRVAEVRHNLATRFSRLVRWDAFELKPWFLLHPREQFQWSLSEEVASQPSPIGLFSDSNLPFLAV